MSTDVQVEVRVARPRVEVARFATNWRNDIVWIGALSEARLVTEPPFGVGSQVARVASFLGRRIEYVNEVVEYEPGARLVMQSVKAPFPMTVTYEFEDVEGGTLTRIRAQGDASSFYRLAGPCSHGPSSGRSRATWLGSRRRSKRRETDRTSRTVLSLGITSFV